MQDVIIKKTVDVPNCPQFKKDQKVRVKDGLADTLVGRGLAVYDKAKPAKTEKAKKVVKKKEVTAE